MEESCPATPLNLITGRSSKSPLPIPISSPDSEGMKTPDRLSPDSRCVICLGRLHNKSFTDSCLHQFCFQCLLQWSKVKPECPLCKQPFKSIIHSVRSNMDYDQYHVERREPTYVISDLLHYELDPFAPVQRRFRYSTTMTPEYFREIAESFNYLSRTRRIQEGSYRIPPLVPVDNSPAHNTRRSRASHQHNVQQRRQRGDEFRRNIYTQDLWVQELADVSGRERQCNPQFYRENEAQVHRLIPWLSREVRVLLNDCENHVNLVLDRIVRMLTQHPIRSREFRQAVYPYFQGQTDHFIHEFYTFARSLYDMAGFDENARYAPNPNYATEVQEIESSNDDSDIEVLDMTPRDLTTNVNTRLGLKKALLKRANESLTNSDEPVAGPSGLNAGGTSEPIEICESDPDEVKILDYVKPEPDVVTLSSDEEPRSRHRNPAYFKDSDEELQRTVDNDGNNFEGTISCVSSNEDSKPLIELKRSSRNSKGKSNGYSLECNQKRKYVIAKSKKSSRTRRSSRDSDSSGSRISPIRIRRLGRKRVRSSSRSESSTVSDSDCMTRGRKNSKSYKRARNRSRSTSLSDLHVSSKNGSAGRCRIRRKHKRRRFRSSSSTVSTTSTSTYSVSSISSVSNNTSSSDYEPISKYLNYKKDDSKTRSCRSSDSKNKKNEDRKTDTKRYKSNSKENTKNSKNSSKDKIKVKSCVVVPKNRTKNRGIGSSSYEHSPEPGTSRRGNGFASDETTEKWPPYWSSYSSGSKSRSSTRSDYENRAKRPRRLRSSSSPETKPNESRSNSTVPCKSSDNSNSSFVDVISSRRIPSSCESVSRIFNNHNSRTDDSENLVVSDVRSIDSDNRLPLSSCSRSSASSRGNGSYLDVKIDLTTDSDIVTD